MTSTNTWSEIDKAKNENRRELVLVGTTYKERVFQCGLDTRIYSLDQLNFLDMSGIGLKQLSSKIGNLVNLTNLVLVQNDLSELPSEVGNLKKLKLLDVNNNSLTRLPEEVSSLSELQTLNCNNNMLEEFVEVTKLSNLHCLDVSHNKLKSLPVGIDSAEFTALLTIKADDNQIEELSQSLWDIPTLKNLDLSNNNLTSLPANLADCFKLKDFKCTGNNLKDRRLKKLVEQCSTKAILDYLSNQKGSEAKGGAQMKGGVQAKGGASKKANKKEKQKIEKETELQSQSRNTIKVLKFLEESSVLVKATTPSHDTRPYIVCCVVRNVNFNKNNSLFKLFINLQTKLHDINCGKRTTATIATHDLEKVTTPILYDARQPKTIKITPLNGSKAVSSDLLVRKLLKEAEMLRKEKKKSNFGGVHKYLSLVADKRLYACLVDSQGVVISFPPITNSQETRVTSSTRHLLLEVTGPSSLEVCKKVMDELVYGITELGVGTDCSDLPKNKPTSDGDISKNGEEVTKNDGKGTKNSGEEVKQSGEEVTNSGEEVTNSGEEGKQSVEEVKQSGEEVKQSGEEVKQSGEAVINGGEGVGKDPENVVEGGEIENVVEGGEIEKVVKDLSKVTTADEIHQGGVEKCGGGEVIDENVLMKDGDKVMVVEQVKVIDEFNKLKVLYPSRTDLANQDFNVVRNE